jgi:16S rRNA (adenine1518-N6/adenine1519-N6)-dimethyltransferase
VESVLVAIERRPAPAVDVDYARLKEVIRAGFAHRRKMLRHALLEVVEPAAFAAAGVDPSSRAEELGIAQWGRLAGW